MELIILPKEGLTEAWIASMHKAVADKYITEDELNTCLAQGGCTREFLNHLNAMMLKDSINRMHLIYLWQGFIVNLRLDVYGHPLEEEV